MMNDSLNIARPLRLGLAGLQLAWLAALLACLTPRPAVATSAAVQTAVVAPAKGTEVETEFKALLAREDDARQDMSNWLRATEAIDDHLADKPKHLLSMRMENRLAQVSAAYDKFLASHPTHPQAALRVAAFRAEVTEDLEAIRRWEEDRAVDPESPEPWNELAHYLVHNGRMIDGFESFEKSISLAPDSAVYLFDYATALLLYRNDAISHYKLTETTLFSRVLVLYRRGLRLEPESFRFAAEYARTFYLIRPARTAEGFAAWNEALRLATEDGQRDEVRTHLARYAIHAGHLNLARIYLDQVKDARLDPVKESLLRKIQELTKPQKSAPVPAS